MSLIFSNFLFQDICSSHQNDRPNFFTVQFKLLFSVYNFKSFVYLLSLKLQAMFVYFSEIKVILFTREEEGKNYL
jgi:hypothetical protein